MRQSLDKRVHKKINYDKFNEIFCVFNVLRSVPRCTFRCTLHVVQLWSQLSLHRRGHIDRCRQVRSTLLHCESRFRRLYSRRCGQFALECRRCTLQPKWCVGRLYQVSYRLLCRIDRPTRQTRNRTVSPVRSIVILAGGRSCIQQGAYTAAISLTIVATLCTLILAACCCVQIAKENAKFNTKRAPYQSL